MIGKTIQKKRKAAGLTQAQLAELLGVTAPAVNRWEKDLSFPDAALLAPLARCLSTDLNELFSFYDSLSDKERELIVKKASSLLLEPDDSAALTYIEENLRHNLSDGMLYFEMAQTLYGAHLFKKAFAPRIYTDRITAYYERALELIPEKGAEICESLMSIYASLGDREKAEFYCSKLPGSSLERMENHADMLFLLKDYSAAAEEIKALVLRKAVALITDLGMLHDTLVASDNQALAEVARCKADGLRSLFELWEGFEILGRVSSAVSAMDGEAYGKHMKDLILSDPHGKRVSSSPLFDGVQLGGTEESDRSVADSMADLMQALSKLDA